MTGILLHRHPERSPLSLLHCGKSAGMRRGKTMYWCYLTSGNERTAIEISRLRPSDDGAKRYQNSAALLIFMRRTFPAEPVEPTEPAEPLSHAIAGRHVQRANFESNTKTPSSAKDLPRTECIRGATLIHVIGHALSEVPAYFRQLTYALRRRILGFSFRCALCGPFGRLPSIHSHQVGLSVRAFPALISASTV